MIHTPQVQPTLAVVIVPLPDGCGTLRLEGGVLYWQKGKQISPQPLGKEKNSTMVLFPEVSQIFGLRFLEALVSGLCRLAQHTHLRVVIPAESNHLGKYRFLTRLPAELPVGLRVLPHNSTRP